MYRFIIGQFRECPYYRPGDEYSIVKKTDVVRIIVGIQRYVKIRQLYAEKYSVYSCLLYDFVCFYRNKFYHPVVLINHVVHDEWRMFLNYMQYMDQQQPCKSVVSNNGNQIVDSCDQRTGSNCRVNMDFLKNNGMQVPTALEISIARSRDKPMHPDTAYANIRVLPLII